MSELASLAHRVERLEGRESAVRTALRGAISSFNAIVGYDEYLIEGQGASLDQQRQSEEQRRFEEQRFVFHGGEDSVDIDEGEEVLGLLLNKEEELEEEFHAKQSAQEQRVDLVRSVPALAKLSERTLDGLAARFEPVRFDMGDVILREGEPGAKMYFLLEGQPVVSTVKSGDVRTLREGEHFGELAMTRLGSQTLRSATVTCRGPTACWVLSRASVVAECVVEELGTLLDTGSVMAALPTAADYCYWGISAAGIAAFLERHSEAIGADTTTSDVCHQLIKPATTPPGWRDEATLVNRQQRWYNHSYRCEATDHSQDEPPPGTRSMCDVLRAEPSTCHMVGRANVFFSHAWTFSFRDVCAAIVSFAAAELAKGEQRARGGAEPPQTEELFFWFDCFAVDEHAAQNYPQSWWSSTFRVIPPLHHRQFHP
jgi:CRP-like cAMP-binding protein